MYGAYWSNAAKKVHVKMRRFTPTETPSKLEAGVENPIIAIGYLSIIRALLWGPWGNVPATRPKMARIM